MSSAEQSSDRPGPQALAEMLTHYLRQRAAAHTEGFGSTSPGREVVPFEAVPVQPIDPRLAWDEALAALHYYGPAWDKKACHAVPDWAALATAQEPVTALAFCLGNYPQMVRDLYGLLHAAESAAQPSAPARPLPFPAATEWATKVIRQRAFPQVLLAVAALRLARQYEEAEQLAEESLATCPSEWQPALANERAALAWHRGRREEAAAQWQSQAASAPVLFNRGMAALFLGRFDEARNFLTRAVEQLPEESGWHHLGRLYLALAQMRE